ncbi:MAG: TldD/PmbA family protein [Candidatus Micrarchaeota archaeon]|mgnify:CR=1 FL=1
MEGARKNGTDLNKQSLRHGISSIADKIFASLQKYAYADAILTSTNYTSISLKDGKIESAREGQTQAMSCRMLLGGSFGFASSNKVGDFASIISEAAKLAKIPGGKIKICEPQANRAKILAKVRQDPSTHSYEEKIKMLTEIEKDVKIAKVSNTNLVYYDSSSKIFTLNSAGAFIEEDDVRTGAAAHIYAKENGRIETSFEQVKAKGGFEILGEFPQRAAKAAMEAVSLLSAKHGPAGKMSAILDPELAGVLSHEAVGHACEADGIANYSSCLRGKMGKRIGNEVVTIKDSPVVFPNLWGSYRFDDEATKARGTVLVDRGALKGYLTSLETANEYGNILTGNARGDSNCRPIVRMSNTYFEKGDAKIGELFEGVKNGVYLAGCKEGQVSPKLGNFTFAAKFGFLIKNGERAGMIKDCSINGNILESLHNIDMVANDLEFLPGTCGKDAQSASVTTGSPHLRINNILVG